MIQRSELDNAVRLMGLLESAPPYVAVSVNPIGFYRSGGHCGRIVTNNYNPKEAVAVPFGALRSRVRLLREAGDGNVTLSLSSGRLTISGEDTGCLTTLALGTIRLSDAGFVDHQIGTDICQIDPEIVEVPVKTELSAPPYVVRENGEAFLIMCGPGSITAKRLRKSLPETLPSFPRSQTFAIACAIKDLSISITDKGFWVSHSVAGPLGGLTATVPGHREALPTRMTFGLCNDMAETSSGRLIYILGAASDLSYADPVMLGPEVSVLDSFGNVSRFAAQNTAGEPVLPCVPVGRAAVLTAYEILSRGQGDYVKVGCPSPNIVRLERDVWQVNLFAYGGGRGLPSAA